MANVREVIFKIGNMRTAVPWVVYPHTYSSSHFPYNTMFLQGDKRALTIDLTTKKGMLSNGKAYPGFATTQPSLGGTEVDVSDEIIALCTESQSKSGNEFVGACVRIA